MTALLNPEAYKKYKNSKSDSNKYVSEDFLATVMKETGMTKEEAEAFMRSKSPVEDETLDQIVDPFTI